MDKDLGTKMFTTELFTRVKILNIEDSRLPIIRMACIQACLSVCLCLSHWQIPLASVVSNEEKQAGSSHSSALTQPSDLLEDLRDPLLFTFPFSKSGLSSVDSLW